jgi:hypothetical protein
MVLLFLEGIDWFVVLVLLIPAVNDPHFRRRTNSSQKFEAPRDIVYG